MAADRSEDHADTPTDSVTITFTKDEALILFEWLARSNDDESIVVVDQAENRVLWDLECSFESLLAEPFQDEYLELLEAARSRVRDPSE